MPDMPLSLILHICVTLVFAIRILDRRLAVQTTLAWIIVISAFPIFGLAVYFLFGDHRLGRKRLKLGPKIRKHFQHAYDINTKARRAFNLDVSPYFNDLSDIITQETGFLPSLGNTFRLLSRAEDVFETLLADLETVTESCYLEFYIIDPVGRVCDVLDRLCWLAQRGVDCRIIADDVGSKRFFKSGWPSKLEDAGVMIVRSLPVGIIKSLSKRTDLRNHRKIIIIDQKVAYTGSYNLTDPKYFKKDANVGEWVDIMVRMEGHVVSSLACVFNTDFIFDHVGFDFTRDDLHDLPQDTVSTTCSRNAVFQVLPSGPEMQTSLIYEVIVSAIYGARQSVIIVTPYFVPDDALILSLCNAARRGINVKIIIPHRVDSRLARYAGQSSFEPLLQAGVNIYRYVGGMLHTKAILIDEVISFAGTVNMDLRSFYLNLEITLCAYDENFAQSLNEIITRYLLDSREIDLEEWRKRGRLDEWKENVFRLAGPLL